MSYEFEDIKPGDLITSDFMNSIINAIESLDDRVIKLEESTPVDNRIEIVKLDPESGSYRLNQQLTVMGKNFEYLIGGLRVYVGEVNVIHYIEASDTKVVFKIPHTIPNISEGGTDVHLIVSNRSSTDSRMIKLKPVLESLQGTVNVKYISVDPSTLTENQQADFMYKLISSTNIPADFIITPTISDETNPDSWPQPQVLDEEKKVVENNRISMLIIDEKIFYIRIVYIPSDTDNTTFTLTVNAEAGIVNSSEMQIFTISEETELQDETFSLTRAYSDPTDILNADKTIISLKEKDVGYIYLEAKDFTFVGDDESASGEECDIYEFQLNTGEETSGWGETLEGIGMPDHYEIRQNEVSFSKFPYFKLEPGTGASKEGMIEFSMKRRGASKRRFLLFKLSLTE